MDKKSCDVLIIGGGPAGLSSGIYASRELLDTVLLEKAGCGGLVMLTDLIENYPGFPDGISGMDLIEKFKKQAERFDTKIKEYVEVKSIRAEGSFLKVKTEDEEYIAKAVIAATGSTYRKLGIPGEDQYSGKGISYCATCDGPLFKEKDIVVVGGGDSAVQEALFLTRFVKSVTLVHRREELRASKILQQSLRDNDKIKVLLCHVPLSIKGDKFVRSVVLKDLKTGIEKEVNAGGIFIFIGFIPGSDFLKGLVQMDDAGFVKTDENMQTSMPGIFAAGDVRSKKIRQVAVSCSEGVIAALSASKHIRH